MKLRIDQWLPWRRKAAQEETHLELEVSVQYHISPEEERARELLKEATALFNDDPDSAIARLREAYTQIAHTDVDYTVATFLRLPMYLQKASRRDEAWREFNRLLTDGYPNMPEGDTNWCYMESAVYDKMRLFLQREKRLVESVRYGVLSLISNIRADLTPRYASDDANRSEKIREIGRQSDRERAERAKLRQTREALDEPLMKLLKRARLLHCHDDALEVFYEWVSRLPEVDDAEYERQFEQALHR